ncbi:MAG: ATP synthase F1 subunit epsilon [Prevotellaceae bacterium]|jgi:F-type H+-transporting ATPase subunit epsilon|nr:ATP synthase F1 subunit epsilon [Prevotellaceae bacterium]
MKLEIISPQGVVLQKEITQVSLPGAVGIFTVLNNHAPIISTLREGKVSYQTNEKAEEEFEIEKGVVEVKKNKVMVFVEQIKKSEYAQV